MHNSTNISYIRIGDNSSENDGRNAPGAKVLSPNNRDDSIKLIRGQLLGVGSGGDVTATPILLTVDDGQSTASTFSASTRMGKFQDEDEDLASIVEVDLTHEDDKEKRSLCNRLKGIFAMLLSTLLTSLNSQILYYLFVELKVSYSKSLYFVWAFLIYTVLNGTLLLFIMYQNFSSVAEPLKDNKRLWYLLVIRGLIGSMVQFVTSHAIDNFAKPAPVSVITAIAPIFVYINAYICLKEKIGLIPILNVFVAIAGVVVMNLNELTSRPEHRDSKPLIGTGIATIAMFLLSVVTVVIRFLRNVHPLVVNMAFGVMGIVVQGIILLCENKHEYFLHDKVVFGLCVGSATLTSIGNFFYNMSLKYESAGMVSLIRTCDVLFNFLFQFFLFGLQPDLYTAVGGSLVLAGVLCVTLRKIVGESSENSKLRKYLWFLLY